ncbi:MAG: ATP-binding protein, partial [Nitrospirota bacterium]|nr:ATP-binding protein [Nitrospirota bacterium]
LLCVPLGFKDEVIGTISVFDKEKDPTNESYVFTEEDLQLLSMLASQASVAIQNAFMYDHIERLAEENRRRVLELSTLYDVSYAMRRTVKLTQLYHVILTGATISDGLGFNRAMLFIVNERSNVLEGVMAVGPSSASEAGAIWSDLVRSGRTILDFPLLDTEETALRDSPINRKIREIRVPLEDRTLLLGKVIAERKSFNINDTTHDPLIDPALAAWVDARAFAVVPLVARDHAIGLLLVDNLFSGKAIEEENMQFLSMFANQAGLAIENAKMYHNLEQANKNLREAQNKLIQAEKMAALGQMAAGIAHEIRNPLVSIGGFARRLAGRVGEETQEKRYAEIIIKEVRRIEKIVQDILTFSKDSAPAMEECSVNDIVEDAIGLYTEDLAESGCRVVKELASDLPPILVDPQQLMQVLTNIISNAEQAMTGGGELAIRTFIADESGSVGVSIDDTGGGIPEDIMSNIFTPFFTTKVAGTGLGLSICHRIIEKHEGKIEVRSEEGHGTKFVIKLPYRRERRAVKREQPRR